MTTILTPLERALIELVAAENWPGFRIDGLYVKKRENTGVGRYTSLEDSHKQQLNDGDYGAQGWLLEMEGIKHGLGFVVNVSAGAINYLEIAVYGNESWDGVERIWKLV
ncbi:MAG: hypothetical protein IPO81_13735 [Kouleothrix sp.]|nr:hypothetical protein [Kouleothrix sp.]